MDWIDGRPLGRSLRVGLWAVASALALSAPGSAAPTDSLLAAVRASRADRLSITARRDSLRARIEQAAATVDSLKRASPAASGALRHALSRTVAWVALEDSLSRRLTGLEARTAALRSEALAAVDREMADIAATLTAAPDAAVSLRLDRLRAARRTLKEEARETTQTLVPQPIEVDADDGPEEIRQKADLMWDMATQVKRQADQARSRLAGLKTEERLRRQLAVFEGDVGFFDEHTTAGRSVSTAAEGDKSGPGQEDATVAGPESDRGPDASQRPVAVTGPDPGAGRSRLAGTDGAEDIGGEMAALETRIRTLVGRERALREQSDALRLALRRMLESAP